MKKLFAVLGCMIIAFAMFILPVSAAPTQGPELPPLQPSSTFHTYNNATFSNVGIVGTLGKNSIGQDMIIPNWQPNRVDGEFDLSTAPTSHFVFFVGLNKDYQCTFADTVKLAYRPGGVGGFISHSVNLYKWQVVLLDSDYVITAFGESQSFPGVTGQSYNITWGNQTLVPATSGIGSVGLLLFLNKREVSQEREFLSMSNPSDVSWGFGNPSSPEANAFLTPNNDHSNNFDELESGLVNGSKDGLNKFSSLLGNLESHLTGFSGALLCFGNFMSDFMGLPKVSSIFSISLALGLFAFILGVGASIIKAVSKGGKK